MGLFDTAAVLLVITAIAGYINRRMLRLPLTSGTLVVALASSLVVVVVERVFPGSHLRQAVDGLLNSIDFNEALMHGMLSFLLFAGALHVDLAGLLEHKWTVASLATVGVLLSTGIIGALSWWAFRLTGADVPLSVCFVLGALISPTDPIAVMGLLKELRAPRSLESQIAGESLFNDGVGVVVFFALLAGAGIATLDASAPEGMEATGLLTFFVREVVGGVALGLGMGYVGYRALKSVDDHPLELLITVALVMFTYTLSFWIHVSGPIAVVVAGLLIGNPGRKFAMSDTTREHVDAFWSMLDEVLNALLFLLIGLEVFALPVGPRPLLAALLVIPAALIARLLSVSVPVIAMSVRGRFIRGIVPILTWCGLRGGISVAMVLSLPHFPAREYLLAATYGVVVFSILVQGLTVRRVLTHYRVGE